MAVRAIVETEFDLGVLVREHIKRHKSPDPFEIADDVIKEISDEELQAIVELLLPVYVRERLDAYRRSQQQRKRSKKGKKSTSAKWEAADDEWDAIFWTSVYIPGIGRKFLGDCTKNDVAAIVSDYEDLAASNQAMANAYNEILGLMKRRRVTIASELPAELVIEAFGDEDEED